MRDLVSWGVFRELAHSPGRESDDAEILRLTAKQLEARGFHVTLKSPDDLDAEGPRPQYVFSMCERTDALRRLRAWERGGTRIVNTPTAVLNTYRERMLALWRRAAVPFPRSRIVPTGGPASGGSPPVWVKRADVHNTQGGDVVFADTPAALDDALRGLARRGIPRAVLQAHVDGDLVKFYGIGCEARPPDRPRWFRWFYHAARPVAGHAFDPARLAALAARAALALGLEVFGGDALVAPRGAIWLIDLNAWPSFALYREEAAAEIAGYLEPRFGGPPAAARR